MIIPIQFPKMHGVRSERTKTFRFTLLDDTIVRKKLKEHIPATKEGPRIHVFDDDTFTVGRVPIVYKRTGNKPDDEWLKIFQFKALHIEYDDREEDDNETT